MVVELSDLREQQDDLINTNGHNLGVSPNGDEPSRALGELCRAPWRRRGEKPRLDRMGSRPWRTSIDPFSDSSVSTACTTSKSAPSSPSGGQALIFSPMTWPNSPGSVTTSGLEHAERFPFLSPRCPGGCLNPSLTRDLARADPVTRMRYQPYSARALSYPTSSTSAAYILPPLSAREPGKDANPREILTTAETTLGSASNSRELLTTAESTATQLAMQHLDPPLDDADLESRFYASDVEGDFMLASDSEAPKSPRVVDPALMAMLEETVAQLQKVSGVWDPEVWLKAWKALLKHKCVVGVAMLFKSVRTTTEWALQKKAYRSLTIVRHSNGLVDLASIFPTARKIHWFGRANVDFPDFMNENETPQKKTPPPLIFTEMKALEVATQLRKIYGKQKQIFVVTELTGFDENGDINLSRQKAMNPYCLSLRSDFSRFVTEASTEMKGSFASMQQHLCAPTDPYVFHSSGVTVFRGARVDGFPFLEEPYQVDVLATAMPPGRPPVQKVHTQEGQSMWYAYRNDHQSLQERYQLLGLVAMQAMRSSLEDPTDLPILIMTALGSEVYHPCDAIISILKNWRRRFAPYFSSVYVCWGRPSCSNAIDYADDAVNRSIYRLNVLEGISAELAAAKVVQWHWDSRELKMSCARGKLEKTAMQCRKIAKKTSHASGKGGRSTPPPALIRVLAPSFAPAQTCPKIDMSTDQRRETSQNALAALKSLNELSVSNNSADGRTSPALSQSEAGEIESDEDDEPPPSLTHIGMAPALEQLQTPSDQMLGRGSHARLSLLPPPSARASVVSIGGGIAGLAPASPKAQRQAALESSKELIGHKSSSATMTGIVLAGGIRNLLGFEKQNESNEDVNDSPMKRSMMKTYSKQLKEDGISVASKKEKKKNANSPATSEVADLNQEEPSKTSTGCEQAERTVVPSFCSKELLGEPPIQPPPDGEHEQGKEHTMRRHSSTGQISHVRRLSLQAMESMGTHRRNSKSDGEALGLARELVAQGGANNRFSTAALKEQLSEHIHARVENPHDDGVAEHTELDEGHHIPQLMEVERRRRSVEEVMGKGAIVVDKGRRSEDVGNPKLATVHTSNKRRMSDIGAMMNNLMDSKRRESAEEVRAKMREELLKPRKTKDEGPQRRSSLSHVDSRDAPTSARRGSFSGGETSYSSAAVAAGGRRLSASMVSSMSRDQSEECLTAKQLSEDLLHLTKRLSVKGTDSNVIEDEDHYKGEKRSTKKLVMINSSKISVEDKLSVKQEADRLRAQFEMAEKDSSLGAEIDQGRTNSLKTKTSIDFLSNATAKSEDELVSETQEALDRFRQRVGEGAGSRSSLDKKGSKSSLKIMQSQGFDDEDAPPEGWTKADHRRISCAQQQGIIGGRNLFF